MQRPRSPFFFGVGPGCPGKGPVGASASLRPGPASSPPFPSRRRRPYPQDVVAFRAPARDLDALRGPHGGGRSVRLGPDPSCSPPPEHRPLRSAPPRSTWDVALAAAGEPGRTARRESVAAAPTAAATPQTAPPASNHRKGPDHARAGRGLTRARETAEIQFVQPRHLATDPWVGQALSRRVPAGPKERLLCRSSPWWPVAGKGLLLKRIGVGKNSSLFSMFIGLVPDCREGDGASLWSESRIRSAQLSFIKENFLFLFLPS